jgi:phosphatidylinositol alpha-1,6-mannosyltransferase
MHTPPRVLLVLAEVSADVGGIENVGRSLMRLLAAKQRLGAIDYRVASLRGPRDDDDVRELGELAGSRLAHFADSRWTFSLSVLWQMVRWADLVVFIHSGLASLLALVPRRLRPVTMTWIYGVEVWSPLALRPRLGLARSDHIVAITEFTIRKALNANPWLPRPRCCHLGIPAEVPAGAVDVASELGFTPSPHDILIVGRMARSEGWKGHDKLIAVMDDVGRAVPDARLIVIGTGDNIDFYKDMARRKSIEGRVLFPGFVRADLLEEVYRCCGVFAMPSRQEGFGLVYLEAMRAGLPCVASNCDGAQEIVLNGETGFLVDPDDPTALTEILTRLLTDGELRQRLGCQGRARFQRFFTEEQFHQRFWDLLRTALTIPG